MLTQTRLKEALNYCKETGDFTRIIKGVHKRVGCPNARGYLRIMIDGILYYSHRLAFLYMLGDMPSTVDHINRIKNDNSWENLRECTQAENRLNCSRPSNNSSGVKGVSWYKRSRKWRADFAGKHLGVFSSIEEATLAYDTAATHLSPEFAYRNVSKELRG